MTERRARLHPVLVPHLFALAALLVFSAGCDDGNPSSRAPAPSTTAGGEPPPESEGSAQDEPEASESTANVESPADDGEDDTQEVPGFWTSRPLGPPMADPDDRSLVVVATPDKTVDLGEVETQLRALPRSSIRHLTDADGRQRFAEKTAAFVLLAQEARRRGIFELPRVEFDYLAGLATARRQVFLDQLSDGISEDDVKRYYEENTLHFKRPELRQGVLYVAKSEEKAQATRELLLQRAPGVDGRRTRTMMELVRASSIDDATRSANGRLEPLGPPDSQDNPRNRALSAALHSIGPYDVSNVFELKEPAGWGFVMLEGTIEPRDDSVEEADEEIRAILISETAPEKLAEFMASKEGEATIEPEPLAGLELQEGDNAVAGPNPTLPAKALEKPVITAGETVLSGAHVLAALRRWPAALQRKVVSGELQDELLDELSLVAVLAEEAREMELTSHPLATAARDRTAVMELRDQVMNNAIAAAVSEETIAEYFEENEESFSRPERRRGTAIQLASEAEASSVRSEILNAAPVPDRQRTSVARRIAATRAATEEARKSGGRLPYVAREQSVEGIEVAQPLRDALFSMGMHEVTEPIQVEEDGQTYWYVVVMDGLRGGTELTLEQARASIRMKLEQGPSQEAWTNLQNSLQEGAELTLKPESLEKLRLDHLGKAHDH